MQRVSFLIPTNRSYNKLLPCLNALDKLDYDAGAVEIVVVFNGMDSSEHEVADRQADSRGFSLITDRICEANISAAKNRAFERSSGGWIFLINDDTLVRPDFVRAHLQAHDRLGRPAMVLGRSAWKRHADETVFDRMIATTSMVFFYDQMTARRWYNFRHAWNLNLSVERRYIDSVRFEERLKPVNFDDLEWAYRVERTHGLRVWYEPDAVNVHDHRYTLAGYLNREAHLGRMAALLWDLNPDCFAAIFGSPLDQAYLSYCRRYVEVEGRRESERIEQLAETAGLPIGELGASEARRSGLIPILYQAHVPLKRLAFRRGILRATDQRPDERETGTPAVEAEPVRAGSATV